MMKLKSIFMAALSALFLASTTAHAASVEVYAYDTGWYQNGFHSTGNENIAVGLGGYNNFFAFDLSTVTGTVTSATLAIAANGSPLNTNPSVTYNVYDVTTDIGSLVAGTGGAAAQTDLGSGTLYGSTTITALSGNPMPAVTVGLAGGLTDINAALGGLFAVGGASDATSYLWGSSNGVGNVKLVLEIGAVPLPAAFPLFLAALGGLGIAARRRKRA